MYAKKVGEQFWWYAVGAGEMQTDAAAVNMVYTLASPPSNYYSPATPPQQQPPDVMEGKVRSLPR